MDVRRCVLLGVPELGVTGKTGLFQHSILIEYRYKIKILKHSFLVKTSEYQNDQGCAHGCTGVKVIN